VIVHDVEDIDVVSGSSVLVFGHSEASFEFQVPATCPIEVSSWWKIIWTEEGAREHEKAAQRALLLNCSSARRSR